VARCAKRSGRPAISGGSGSGEIPTFLHSCTLLGAVQPIIDGTGDIHAVEPYPIAFDPRQGLLPGDLGLTVFEDELALA
jgi:hypothetical protein